MGSTNMDDSFVYRKLAVWVKPGVNSFSLYVLQRAKKGDNTSGIVLVHFESGKIRHYLVSHRSREPQRQRKLRVFAFHL